MKPKRTHNDCSHQCACVCIAYHTQQTWIKKKTTTKTKEDHLLCETEYLLKMFRSLPDDENNCSV